MLGTMEAVVLTLLAVGSGWVDWQTRTIPNLITLGGICAGFLLALVGENVLEATMGFLASCFLLLPFRLGWLGGGDVKLMMAYGALLGPWLLLDLWIGAAVVSVPLAMYMAYKKKRSIRSIGIPYAVPLAITVVWIVGRGLIHVSS